MRGLLDADLRPGAGHPVGSAEKARNARAGDKRTPTGRDGLVPGANAPVVFCSGKTILKHPDLCESVLLPGLPVGPNRVHHFPRSLVQPLPFLLIEITKNELACGPRPEMNVGRFPAHCVEQAEFLAWGLEGR